MWLWLLCWLEFGLKVAHRCIALFSCIPSSVNLTVFFVTRHHCHHTDIIAIILSSLLIVFHFVIKTKVDLMVGFFLMTHRQIHRSRDRLQLRYLPTFHPHQGRGCSQRCCKNIMFYTKLFLNIFRYFIRVGDNVLPS